MGPSKSKSKYWRGKKVVAFNEEGDHMRDEAHAIARIFSNPLRYFQLKTDEGVLLDNPLDI